MVQKPPVDIEWYDDGFSMEEQAKLREQYIKEQAAKRPKIKVTEKYHEITKDQIISELRQKLAANEEYIKELEDDLQEKYSDVKESKEYKKLYNKYIRIKNLEGNGNITIRLLKKKLDDMKNSPDSVIKDYENTIENLKIKHKEKIEKLELEIKRLREARDVILSKLCSQ